MFYHLHFNILILYFKQVMGANIYHQEINRTSIEIRELPLTDSVGVSFLKFIQYENRRQSSFYVLYELGTTS